MSARRRPGLDLPTLARRHGIPDATLRKRLARNGGDLAQAVSKPPCTKQAAGRIGAKRSPWRYPDD
jgi:transposase-like protein